MDGKIIWYNKIQAHAKSNLDIAQPTLNNMNISKIS